MRPMTVPATHTPDLSEVFGSLEYHCRLIWEARIAVNQEDLFFFDHPLDHVPAVMLTEAALRLADQAMDGAASPWRAGISRVALRFGQFCELSPEPVVRLWAAERRAGLWNVEFRQDENIIGAGELQRRAATAPSAPAKVRALAPVRASEPVPAGLVHRAHTQNVLIGGYEARASGGHRVDLLTPVPGHYFRRRSPRVRAFGEVIEGIRQFGILLAHEAREVVLGRQFIVKTIELELERPISRHEPVVLRSTGLPRHRGRGTGRMDFTIEAGRRPVGTAQVTGTVVSAEVYQRIRGTNR